MGTFDTYTTADGDRLTCLRINGQPVLVVDPNNTLWATDGRSYGPYFKLKPATPAAVQFPAAKMEQTAEGVPCMNHGVITGKVHDRDNGRVETGNPPPTDDTGKGFVTVRSKDKTIIDAVKSVTPADRFNVQAYPPGHWALTPGLDFGLLHIQGPTRADGKAVMVHNQNDFDDGAAGFAEALRKADPNFKENVVVDLRQSTSPFDAVLTWLKSPSPAAGLPWYVVVGVAALVFILMKRSQSI
jgi:hypothetical protein